jgi:hypothetical protein
MDLQGDPAQQESSLEAPMRVRRALESELGGDRDAQVRVGERTCEPVELGPTRNGIVLDHVELRAMRGRWFDAVWMSDAPAKAQVVEATLERLATRKREHCIERRELLEPGEATWVARVDHGIRASPAHEILCSPARRRPDNVRAAMLGELDRVRADRTRCAEDQHALVAANVQVIVNAVHRCQRGYARDARVAQI